MFKHLLVPLDGSNLAEAALPAALNLAARFDSEITLLRVVKRGHFHLSIENTEAYGQLTSAYNQQVSAEVVAYLKALKGSLRQQGYIVHTHTLASEAVANAIMEVAEGIGVDTIVMSTHGRSGVSRFVFGSVADRVLRQVAVPVLLVRALEETRDWQETAVAAALEP